MRLSDWRDVAPRKELMTPKVLGVIDGALDMLGADADPECWVLWGDDPAVRYSLLVPTAPGLLVVSVRVNVPGEGPRATGKLVRWPRVQASELSVELLGPRRMVNFQLEGNVLRGTDDEADAITAFVRLMYDAMDGRTWAGSVATPGAGGPAAAPKRRQKPVPRLPAPKAPTP